MCQFNDVFHRVDTDTIDVCRGQSVAGERHVHPSFGQRNDGPSRPQAKACDLDREVLAWMGGQYHGREATPFGYVPYFRHHGGLATGRDGRLGEARSAAVAATFDIA